MGAMADSPNGNAHHEVEPPEKRKIARVEVDRTLCIGSATCIALASEAFALDNENKAVVQPGWKKHDDETLWEAAKSCPVFAIKLFDEDGKQIYP